MRMNILGIETSCDETGVAIVNDRREILADLLLSQIDTHTVFGGVVPEIAARSHLDHLDRLIATALTEAKLRFQDLDGVAATSGPGLIGGVMVGMMAGKAISLATHKPFIGINHLEAHLLTPRLVENIKFPYLVLLVSGGHTQILVAEAIGTYHLWGTTRDDAVGECFDKSAKLMGLPYPGGPNLEKLAKNCSDPSRALRDFPFPIPLQHSHDMDFSFSGLKTRLRNVFEQLSNPDEDDLADMAYAFQHTIAETLSLRVHKAMTRFQEIYHVQQPCLIVCGGVSANQYLRGRLKDACKDLGFELMAPPLKYCTDNGVMVAWAGVERLKVGLTSPLTLPARPRWPLENLKEDVS